MELDLLNLLLVLLAAWLFGRGAVRLGYPAVLGELAAGILLGPPLLGLLHGGPALAALAELGVLLMMLYVGMEIDPAELGRASRGGLLAALGGFIVPFALGTWLVYAWGGGWLAALFVGIGMGVTSLATKSRILSDLRILDTRVAHVMMAGALVSDTLSLVLFAGVIGVATAGALDVPGVLALAGRALVFFALAWWAGARVFPPLYRWLARRGLTGRAFHAPLTLLIALTFAEGAHLAGLHGVLGAFLAGMVLRTAISERRLSFELAELVKDVSLGFLAPIFFVTAGFEVSFGALRDGWPLLLAVIAVATVGKIVGTVLFYLPTGHGWREALVIGLGMNDRGAVEIVLAGIALQQGIIDRELFSVMVLMAIATTATVPLTLTPGVRWLARRGELVRASGGRDGVVVVGAGPLGLLLALELRGARPLAVLDRNEERCAEAERFGLRAVRGDALDDVALRDAGVEEAGVLLAATPNASVNVLVARHAHEAFGVPDVRALLTRDRDGGLFRALERFGGRPLFPRPVDPGLAAFGTDAATLQNAVATLRGADAAALDWERHLPLAVRPAAERAGPPRPFDDVVGLEPDETLRVLPL